MKRCDHTSVGMMVWRNSKLLLIERRRPPFGFAPPAGHVDGDVSANGEISFETAAVRELEEEVGLTTKRLCLLIEGRKDNRCRRRGGSWHYWRIYRVFAGGEVRRSKVETKQAGWYDRDQLISLAKRTKAYLAGEVPEDSWREHPGLEPVWLEWLTKLGFFVGGTVL